MDSLELSMRKQHEIAEMTKRQTKEYEKMAERVDKEADSNRVNSLEVTLYIEDILVLEDKSISRERMTQAKADLAAARLVRKNRKEYALLVGMIEDLPSRAETTRKLEDIQEELIHQQERQQQLEARLSERRNHLHALNIILANFQKLLSDEDNELSNDAPNELGEKKEDGDDDDHSNKERSSETMDMG
ncbi:unnamed protein product [Angiostrongylus costaricensis]|uniref:THO complex subunit 7 homolog n=1 Tax=Angiostrongylus costaricensis TaxID=334426 RepID=A0A0R3PLS8_ANGCS|nr:unnamed protein product [Angiostrongylus costaricensis]